MTAIAQEPGDITGVATVAGVTRRPAQAWAHRLGLVELAPQRPADWSAAAVADRMQIAEVFYRFGIAHDEARLDVLATCFTTDALFEVVEASAEPLARWQGSAVIAARLGGVIAEQNDQRRHLMGNVIVDRLDGDAAGALAYGVVTVAAGGELQLGASVLYTADLLRDSDGVWRFARFRIGMDLYAGPKPAAGNGHETATPAATAADNRPVT